MKINDIIPMCLGYGAGFLIIYFSWYGRGLPLEQDLHYVTGKVRLVVVAQDSKNREVKHMQIMDPKTKEYLMIACGNIVAPKKDIASSCILKEERLKETLTIGYYYQPSVLGITNEIPQMATIHMKKSNGETVVVKSYASTKKHNLC